MKRIPIRYKMTLLYSILTAFLLAVFLPVLYFTMRSGLMKSQRELLSMAYEQVSTQFEAGENTDGQNTQSGEDHIDLPAGAAYLVLDAGGNAVATLGMPESLKAIPFSPGKMREVPVGGIDYLMFDNSDTEESDGLLIRVCMPLDAIERALNSIRSVSLIGGPFLITLAALLGLFVARRSLKPIERIISSARIVAAGNLSERIAPAPSRDEVGALTDMFNEMLDQLETSFKREKRFTSDASHELRMPVSVIMAYAETLISEETLCADERASVQIILEEAQRMRRMIAQLLMITRGDEGRYTASMESIDMAEVIGAICDQLKERADGRKIAIALNAASAPLRGDQSLITQMTLNLIENAVKYGLEGGKISVETGIENGMCRLVVTDDGPGIAPEHLPHIFERFYRTDSVRDRSGSGLGLSIVRWIVDLHHGTIDVFSSPAGTRFVVLLPVRER